MSEIKHAFVRTNGINMHVAETGEGFPVVFCHGFPEMWYSWRHQMKAMAEAGFRAIAPDQRGYGETEAPAAIDAYTQRKLVADIVGMLDALGIGKCVIVGHDWGGMVAWNTALMARDSVERVIGINTPFIPRSPVKPTDAMRAMAAGGFHYILYFQTPGVAEVELERDVARSLRGFYQDPPEIDPSEIRKSVPGVFGPAGGGLLDRFADRPHGKFLTDADFDVFVRAFKKSGFRGGLNWYRCIDRSWEESAWPDRSHRAARADDHRRARRCAAARDGRRDEDLGAEPAQDRAGQGFRSLDAAGEAGRSERGDPRFSFRYEEVAATEAAAARLARRFSESGTGDPARRRQCRSARFVRRRARTAGCTTCARRW